MKLNRANKTAILFGSTGLVGSHCLKYLLLSPMYAKVKVFVRGPIKIKHEKLEVYTINFNDLIQETYHNMICDDLFICLGTTIKKAVTKENFYRVHYKYVVLIAEMAHKRGASQCMLVSSVGANSDSRIFYKRVKGQVEEQILRMPFWAIHIFRPSLLLGKRNEVRIGESIAKFIGKRANRVAGSALQSFKPIAASNVANYMLMVAQELNPGAHLHASHHMSKRFK